jgi:hypothetical protein
MDIVHDIMYLNPFWSVYFFSIILTFILMHSPPFIPPLYVVPRGKLFIHNALGPPRCEAERGSGVSS